MKLSARLLFILCIQPGCERGNLEDLDAQKSERCAESFAARTSAHESEFDVALNEPIVAGGRIYFHQRRDRTGQRKIVSVDPTNDAIATFDVFGEEQLLDASGASLLFVRANGDLPSQLIL